ncbi:MAG: energy-coupling factor ABC transporter permease [Actinomycetota bacterium]|jgi:cobalt/nickel transport system permease protein|nr:energy-coupling factor ABC transporter permease [Actinomycetota bacterium]
MHIPDGLVDPATAVVTTAVGAGLVAYALKKSKEALDDRRIPIVGLMAAFVFAAQMVTFPIAGGTSAHLLGGAMAGILLGPWLGGLAMTVVYLVQAIGFADGGITALGANVIAVGFLPAVGGYYLFRGLTRILPGTRMSYLGSVAVVSLATTVAASALVAVFISFGGPLPLIAFPIMVGIHSIVGFGEALISMSVIAAVLGARPDLIFDQDRLPERASAPGGEVA